MSRFPALALLILPSLAPAQDAVSSLLAPENAGTRMARGAAPTIGVGETVTFGARMADGTEFGHALEEANFITRSSAEEVRLLE